LILGSTTLSHSLIERVSVSHAEEMYCRIGFKPSTSAASDSAFGPERAGADRTKQRPTVRPSPRRASLKKWGSICSGDAVYILRRSAKSCKMNSMGDKLSPARAKPGAAGVLRRRPLQDRLPSSRFRAEFLPDRPCLTCNWKPEPRNYSSCPFLSPSPAKSP
jgi:hypothetical protein